MRIGHRTLKRPRCFSSMPVKIAPSVLKFQPFGGFPSCSVICSIKRSNSSLSIRLRFTLLRWVYLGEVVRINDGRAIQRCASRDIVTNLFEKL